MTVDAIIQTALERSRKAIELRPSLAAGRVSLRLEMGEGIKCTTSGDGWTVEVDEPASMGGEDSAPGPYIHAFAAVASCFAISIRFLAIMEGIKIERLSIDIESDFDERPFFDLSDSRPGYPTIRLEVDVKSDANDDRIEALIAEARRKSSWFNTFAHANTIETELVRNETSA